MGRIFTYSELKKGKIPKENFFLYLEETLKKSLEELVVNNYIKGALFYGSVTRNEYNLRSDIDILVLYNNLYALKRMRKIRKNFKNKENVEIEFSPFYTPLAPTPFHRVDNAFFNNLKVYCKDKNIIGKNPLEEIKNPNKKNKRIHHANSIGFIIDSLAKKFIEFDYKDITYIDFLKKILDKPKDIVRESVCIIYNGYPKINNTLIYSDKDLLKLFKHNFSNYPTIIKKLDKIIQLNEEYTKKIKGKITKKEYNILLKKIENHFPCSFNFAIETAEILNKNFF